MCCIRWRRCNRYKRAIEWLERYEPQVADVVTASNERAKQFLRVGHYAHGTAQRACYPANAGASPVKPARSPPDPLYSPGSDFIGMSNDFIVNLIRHE